MVEVGSRCHVPGFLLVGVVGCSNCEVHGAVTASIGDIDVMKGCLDGTPTVGGVAWLSPHNVIGELGVGDYFKVFR